MSADGDEVARSGAIGLVRHEHGASELTRSRARVRLAVAAWLQDFALLETLEFEAMDGRAEVETTLRRLTDDALAGRVRLVLTCGLAGGEGVAVLQERWIEQTLVWLGLRTAAVEAWAGAEASPSKTPPIPRQVLLGRP